MAEPCLPFCCHLLSLTSPLPLRIPPAEPVWCHQAGGKVTQGTGVLGMVFEGGRGDPSPCSGTGTALLSAQPLQTSEVLQEPPGTRHSGTEPSLCAAGAGWHRRSEGLASRWGSAPGLSAARPEETKPSLFVLTQNHHKTKGQVAQFYPGKRVAFS